MRPAFAIASLLLGGCAQTTPSDVCERQAEALCRFLFDCCSDLERYRLLDYAAERPTMSFAAFNELGGITAEYAGSPDQGACEDHYGAVCATRLAYLDAAHAEVRVTLDETKVEACLRPLEDGVDACDPNLVLGFSPTGAACGEMIVGTVRIGDPCYGDAECAMAGSTCQEAMSIAPQDGRSQALEGVCNGPGEVGDECIIGSCGTSLACDVTSGRCVTLGGITAPCNSSGACQPQLYCDFSIAQCTVAPGPGQPCAPSDRQCANALACIDGVCGGTATRYLFCDGA
jgi:hypothetical protein